MKFITASVLLASTIYSTLRYNVFKGIPWADWPTYVMNKSFGLSALALVTIEVLRRRLLTSGPNMHLFKMAGLFAAIHVVLSLVLLSPVYYEKLYEQGKLTGLAGTALVLGAIAAATFSLGGGPMPAARAHRTAWTLAVLGLVIGVHAALQGYATWFTPRQWPGGMPPNTLLSFLLGMVALVSGLWPTRAANHSDAEFNP